MSPESLLRRVEAHLRRNPEETATAFGLRAMNDAGFMTKLRAGRTLRWANEQRVLTAIKEYRPPEMVAAE